MTNKLYNVWIRESEPEDDIVFRDVYIELKEVSPLSKYHKLRQVLHLQFERTLEEDNFSGGILRIDNSQGITIENLVDLYPPATLVPMTKEAVMYYVSKYKRYFQYVIDDIDTKVIEVLGLNE